MGIMKAVTSLTWSIEYAEHGQNQGTEESNCGCAYAYVPGPPFVAGLSQGLLNLECLFLVAQKVNQRTDKNDHTPGSQA